MSRLDLFLLSLFVAILAAVVGGMFAVRHAVLARAESPEVQASWERWREETARASATGAGAGGVSRREAESPVSPALTLLETHFAACVIGVVVTLAVPVGMLLLVTRGLIRGPVRLTRSPAARHSIESRERSAPP